MNSIKFTDAKAHFSELVDRVESGESIDIIRHGKLVARIVPPERKPDIERRRADLDAFRRKMADRPKDEGPCAARSADFLYDEFGLPA